MAKKREKTFQQMLAEGKALVRQDARNLRQESNKNALQFDRYYSRDLIRKNPWGM